MSLLEGLGYAIPGLASLFNAYGKDKARGDYVDALRGQEEYNYNNAVRENEAYQNYLNQAYGAASGHAAAQNAATAAFRDNFLASEAARLKQAKKGKKQLRKGTKKALAMLEPYQLAGLEVLPQHTALYNQGADAMKLFAAYLQTPEQMAKLNQDMPILQHGATKFAGHLPEHMKG